MALYRHTARGTFPGEQWSFNVWTSGVGDIATAQTAWEGALANMFPAGVLALYSPDIVVTEASTASVEITTGKQINRLDAAVSHTGTSLDPQLPPQVAVVVSLKTVFATRRGRGRFYLPAPAANASAAGRISTAAVTTLLNAATSMRGTLDLNGFQQVIYNGPISATNIIVNRMEVGDVFDVQNRRRNKLVEVRQGTNV